VVAVTEEKTTQPFREIAKTVFGGRPFVYSCIAAVFVTVYILHWGTWGNLIADTFRDQWVFHTLNHGRTLYKDVTYLYGPIPPYLMALVQRIFGENLSTSVVLGTALCAAAAALIYKTARLSLSRPFSAVPAIFFLAVFGIPSYSPFAMMNFILPYSFASTLYATVNMGALFFFLRSQHKPQALCTIGWTTLLAVSFLCRPDTAVTVYAAYALAIWCTGSIRRDMVPLIISAACALTVLFVFLVSAGALSGFKESIIDMALSAQHSPTSFGKIMLGTDQWQSNLSTTLRNALSVAAAVAGVIAASRLPKLAAPAVAGTAIIAATIVMRSPAVDLFRFLPVFAGLTVIAGIVLRKHLTTSDRATKDLFVCAAITAALLSKIALTMTTWHYAFYLIPPGLVMLAIGAFALAARLRGNHVSALIIKAAFLIPAAAAMLSCLLYSSKLPSTKNFVFAHPKGSITGHHPLFVARAAAAYDWISANVPEKASLVTIPEFESAYFYTERETPLRYDVFTPAQIAVIGGEKKVCEMIESHHVDYVLVHSRDYREYGAGAFGVNPGKEILEYLLKDYEKVFATDGDLTSYNDFAIWIFKRKRS